MHLLSAAFGASRGKSCQEPCTYIHYILLKITLQTSLWTSIKIVLAFPYFEDCDLTSVWKENKNALFLVSIFCLKLSHFKERMFLRLSHPFMDFYHPVICTYRDAMLKTVAPTLCRAPAVKWDFYNWSSFVTSFCQWSVRYMNCLWYTGLFLLFVKW